jgi:hypothetical protein
VLVNCILLTSKIAPFLTHDMLAKVPAAARPGTAQHRAR